MTTSNPPGGRLPLLSAKPAVTFPAAEHHRRLTGTKLYCLVTEAHRCEQLAQGCYAAFFPEQDLNPRSANRKSNALPVAPPRHLQPTLRFLKLESLPAGKILRVNECRSAKLCSNRSTHCRHSDLTFFKMATIRHLGL